LSSPPDERPGAGAPELEAGWAAYELPLRLQRADAEDETPRAWKTDPQAVLRNQSWFCALRWFAIAGLGGLAILSAGLLPLPPPWPGLQPVWPAGAAGVLLVLNVASLIFLRRAPAAEGGLWVQIMVDLVVLTAVVHFLGSVGSFAPFMYLFHIVLACIFFPYSRSLVVVGTALSLYLACLVLEDAVAPGAAAPRAVLAGQWLGVAFVSVTVWFLASRLSNTLRLRDRELIAVNKRLESALEERTAHLLRTTHQLKAPFAAIHANTQLLADGSCGTLPPPAATVVGQIASRCEMLSRGITSMLQLANLRSTAQEPPENTEVELDQLVRSCVAAVRPFAARRAIMVDEDLLPARTRVPPDHARLIVENILSNAVAYSYDGQRVDVSLRPRPGSGPMVRVRDRGIGIEPEKLPRIFDDYYRTTEGARHNNASTGLGLAIVRESAQASGVGVRVQSSPGAGTEFSVSFPA
jgi:signal transduction histidine kinase